MSKKKSEHKKLNKIVTTIIIIVLLSLVVIHIYNTKFKKEIFLKESRIKSIMHEKRKDQKDLFETIGWLRVQGTNIDTPIITYTTEEVNMVASKNNFLWNTISDEKLYNKVNIMGHNILNLSPRPQINIKDFTRFDDLMSFVYYDFVKNNKYIQYTVNGKDYIYKIYAVNFEPQYKLEVDNQGNISKKGLYKFAQNEIKNSIYNFDVRVNKDDKIISLITCTRMFGINDKREFVVNARLVHKDERLTNYKVTKTKKYKKVEKKLRGDVENEKV